MLLVTEKKGGMFRLTWSTASVQEKINELPHDAQRKCQKAYDFLIQTTNSAYREFVNKRDDAVAKGDRFNFYDYQQCRGVECALWPHLYPYTSWCGTSLDGRENRLSSKVAYMTKINSEIADYSLDHELLHFHYDLWLWQTVSGAIASARRLRCSPNKALEMKSFFVGVLAMATSLFVRCCPTIW